MNKLKYILKLGQDDWFLTALVVGLTLFTSGVVLSVNQFERYKTKFIDECSKAGGQVKEIGGGRGAPALLCLHPNATIDIYVPKEKE